MLDSKIERAFFIEYDLVEARKSPTRKEPGAHQQEALKKLHDWYDARHPDSGGILVLPTGAGKTFTATRFLCSRPLSEGCKVLWLAHTHHLLEQASTAFGDSVAQIAEPKYRLCTRVVSATPGHFRVSQIEATDDVIVATLQTMCRAWDQRHPELERYLSESRGKLFIVFDEAHHSPAPSYRHFLQELRTQFPTMHLLGLTATPTHTDENKRGWLKKLFPQGIIYSADPSKLLAQRILAKPIYEEPRTNIVPRFDDREYRKWIGTYRDLPENVVSQLAENRERNQMIAETYVQNKTKYGKTIIFADRWHQCEQLSEFLRARGIKVDTVYSHVDAVLPTVEERNRRTADENARIIADFRQDRLDVLINVRMLTEGTDVPQVQSVFVTRPTRSQILFTQMIGRALRGPKFGGTEDAYIVCFIDNWRQLINWAGYRQLADGLADESVPEYGKRPPLDLISIELVQRLARQMDTGINMTPDSFLSLLPAGWYRVEYQTLADGSEDILPIRDLIMVLDNEAEGYSKFLGVLANEDLKIFGAEQVRLEDVKEKLEFWIQRLFPQSGSRIGVDLEANLLAVARHYGQNGAAPLFFAFQEREGHDLDLLAQKSLDDKWDRRTEDQALRVEYNRNDRLWTTIYPLYDLFKSQYDACTNRLLSELDRGGVAILPPPSAISRTNSGQEPSEQIKQQVRNRDGHCLCCGEETPKLLQVDHIAPAYFGGSNILDNLQLLCRTCNLAKGIQTLNFRDPQSDLSGPLSSFPELEVPHGNKASDAAEWIKFLHRSINFFYRCGAVHGVEIGGRGFAYYNWRIELNAGNDANWLEAFGRTLLRRIQAARRTMRKDGPHSITICAPDSTPLYCAELPELHFPPVEKADNPKAWKKFLQTAIEDYLAYDCLKKVAISEDDGNACWQIQLIDEGEPSWLLPLLPRLYKGIKQVRAHAGLPVPNSIVVIAPGKSDVTFRSEDELAAR